MSENSQNRPTPCPVWLWIILIAGLILLYLLYNHAITEKATWIQQDIKSRAENNLRMNEQLANVSARVDGRDIILVGHVINQTASDNAERIAQQTNGARLVTNQLAVEPAVSAAVPAEDQADTVIIETPATQLPQQQKESDLLTAKVEPLPNEFAPLETEPEQLPSSTADPDDSVKKQFADLDFSHITFEKNSTSLTDKSKEVLDEVAVSLLEHPGVSILVEGHTDTSGNPEINMQISQQRAKSVVSYLKDAGVDTQRMRALGFGDKFPVAPNDTQEGRIKNRRIEIKIKNGD